VAAEKAQRWAGRRRFTIAYEVGHWLLHCELGRRREKA
jgi:Zn-dependent peptidase ImmA (M78 family)